MSQMNPDDLVMEILNDKSSLHEAIHQITLNLSQKSLPKRIPISNRNLDLPYSNNKEIFFKNYNDLQYQFETFNKEYEGHSAHLSINFENDLLVLHSCAETILDYLNNKVLSTDNNVSFERYRDLDILSKLMKSILNKFYQLLIENDNLIEIEKQKQYEELQKQLEIQKEIEIEYQRKLELENELKEIQLQNERNALQNHNNNYLIQESVIPENYDKTPELNDLSIVDNIDKQFFNNIQKLVNNICSQVTSDNPDHALGRLNLIIELLEGKDVPLMGSERCYINLKTFPYGSKVCWNLLNKAIITQAETQFALNMETTLVFASLMSAILGYFPDQWNSTMTALHNRYLQLFNDGDTNIDEDQHLRHLKGVSRLLAAILVADPPPGFNTNPNVSPAYLWSLLAIICHDDIHQSFSSEACIAMLEIGGTKLWSIYGNQFEKLLVLIKTKFDKPGSLSARSLVLMVNKALETRSFDTMGYLTEEVWSKRHKLLLYN